MGASARPARRLFRSRDGFFHADPHPGYVFYLSGNRIAFVDFGMVGRLTEQRREQLIRLMTALVKQEPAAAADVLLDWAGTGTADEAALVADIESFVDQYRGVPLQQLRVGEMMNELVRMLREHHLSLPPDLALLIKAFITLEGIGRELDPGFDAQEGQHLAQRAPAPLEHHMRCIALPHRALQHRQSLSGHVDCRRTFRPCSERSAAGGWKSGSICSISGAWATSSIEQQTAWR